MPRRLPILVFFLVAVTVGRAGQVNWSCAFNSSNLKSSGRAMDVQMTFELGVFTGGFVPSASNVASWAANWRRASLAFYNSEFRHFTGVHRVTANASPFITAGTRRRLHSHSRDP